MNPIAQAAVKAITKLRPNIQDGYLRQRAAEDASARLTIASPRCRIDDKVAVTSEGAEIPIRVFTPLDIDFSLRNGLHVNEDFEGTILFFHGGGFANGDVDLYLSSPEDFFNPYFAPLLEEDLSHQPRTLVVTAEYCPLRDEGETYAARLELEGNKVECVRMLNAIHGYFLYPSVFGFVHDTYKIIESFLDHQPLPQEDDATWLALLGTD